MIDRALRIYLVILIGIFLIEWGSAAFHAFVLHTGYPTNTTLLEPVSRFSDWSNFVLRVSHYGEPGMQTRSDLGLPYPYPLPSLYIFLIFVKLFTHTTRAYVVFTAFSFVAVTSAFWLFLYRRTQANKLELSTVWFTLFLGFPALFVLDRGNIEVFLWLLIAAALVSFLNRRSYLAAFFFALAACMKVYPALYFLLFLPRRQYKAAAIGACLTLVFSVATLAAIGPSIPGALHDMAAGAQLLHVQVLTVHYGLLRFDHSIFGLEKQFMFRSLLHTDPSVWYYPVLAVKSLRVYSILAPVAFAAIYFFKLRHLPLLNQFSALTICAITFPYVSYDYTLVHMYLVFAVFLLYLVNESGFINPDLLRKLPAAMACFAILFAPWAMLAAHLYMGQLRCLTLLLMLFGFMKFPMPSFLFQDRPESAEQLAPRQR